MANLNEGSRKQQVLDRLRLARHPNLGWQDGWVNTVEISNAAVGGSAGTSRIRDLRKEGYVIETRPHPDPTISQYQYRLVSEPSMALFEAHSSPKVIGKVVDVQEDERCVTFTVEPVQQKVWD